jgi:hypothetical protein
MTQLDKYAIFSPPPVILSFGTCFFSLPSYYIILFLHPFVNYSQRQLYLYLTLFIIFVNNFLAKTAMHYLRKREKLSLRVSIHHEGVNGSRNETSDLRSRFL